MAPHGPTRPVREYIAGAEVESAADPDDADLPPQAVSPHSHPTGRILNRPLSNELPPQTHLKHNPHDPFTGYIEALTKNSWRSNTKEIPRFYHFRSVQVPYHTSGKRYLLLPAVDNIMLRKAYPNGSLPSRRKNQ
ncbi:hypothetical protein EVAR_16668_1 [Eumeta japonica]|uniref:Uncharacterized protein n=1 Tax=Eumeta variegata TaxID=151549 RepID=A0A4C1UZG4_EUMVA|nr:hypothetical protein EVAR_16668_1 [Eumeta japonica]